MILSLMYAGQLFSVMPFASLLQFLAAITRVLYGSHGSNVKLLKTRECLTTKVRKATKARNFVTLCGLEAIVALSFATANFNLRIQGAGIPVWRPLLRGRTPVLACALSSFCMCVR